MTDWLLGLGYEGQLATWLVASFLLYFLTCQIAWQYRYPGRADLLGRWIDRLRDHPFTPWAQEALRLVYYLGIPCLAAISGLLGADLLGIKGTDWTLQGQEQGVQGFLWSNWARGVGLAATAGLATWGVWLAGRLAARRAELIPAATGFSRPLWQRVLWVFYDQVHWAFYRSGPILWLDDVYWGTCAGLGLILLQFSLNPALWWALKRPKTAGPALTRLGMAWISAFLFLATRNLWLTTLAHLAVVGLLDRQLSDDFSGIQ